MAWVAAVPVLLILAVLVLMPRGGDVPIEFSRATEPFGRAGLEAGAAGEKYAVGLAGGRARRRSGSRRDAQLRARNRGEEKGSRKSRKRCRRSRLEGRLCLQVVIDAGSTGSRVHIFKFLVGGGPGAGRRAGSECLFVAAFPRLSGGIIDTTKGPSLPAAGTCWSAMPGRHSPLGPVPRFRRAHSSLATSTVWAHKMCQKSSLAWR